MDAMLSRALLASRYTNILLQSAHRQGLDCAALFGDEPIYATRGGRRVWSHRDLGLVSKNLRLATDDEMWGMAPGQRVPLGAFKFACELCVTSETLGEALRRAFKLYDFAGPLRFRLDTAGETASIVVSPPQMEPSDATFQHEWWIWLWHYVAQWFIRAEIGLIRVDFPHQPGVDAEAYAGTFGSRCRFGAEDARIVFARQDLSRPITRTLDELEKFFDCSDVTLSYAPDVARSISISVKIALFRRLQHNEPLPTLEDLALEHGVTGQTLRRWLVAEHSSYRSLKAEVRCIIARHHLVRPDATLGEVASRAGFAEASAFTRAFRTWTGMNVTQFRRMAGGVEPPEDEPEFTKPVGVRGTVATALVLDRKAP